MNGEINKSTWKNNKIPRGKHHNKTAAKTTVSVYLSKKVVERARKHKLNISRISEQSLLSILDYLETQNNACACMHAKKAQTFFLNVLF